ncbi:MAG: redoxin domain-containing protein [Actinobacteria bacterium]|nr:redoxin domain-containing protein [Actinomycetota bacterium]
MTPDTPDAGASPSADVLDGTDPATSRAPRVVALTALVVLIAVAAAYGTRFGSDPTVVDSPLLGQPAPAFTLPLLEDEGELSLRDLEGEIVVVNFWASWCTACREEHDDLIAAAARYRDAGVSVVGIVYQDRPELAIEMLDEMGRGYTYVTDPRSRAAIDFGVFGVPETFFIDRQGTVVAKVIGASDLALLSDTIDAILAGRTPTSVNRAGYEAQPVDLTTPRPLPPARSRE